MRQRYRLILGALLLCVGGYGLWVDSKNPSLMEKKAQDFMVWNWKGEELTRIAWSGFGPPLVVEKKQGQWRISEPIEALAGEVIADFLSAQQPLWAARVLEQPPSSAEFGLVEQSPTIRITSTRKELTLRIGEPLPLGEGVFVQVDESGRVFVLHSQTVQQLFLTLDQVQSRRIYPFEWSEVQRVELLQGTERQWQAWLTQGQWRLSPNNETSFPVNDQFLAFLAALQNTQLIALGQEKMWPKQGPTYTMNITTRDNKSYTYLWQVDAQNNLWVNALPYNRGVADPLLLAFGTEGRLWAWEQWIKEKKK